jgi:stearoyl-CoA desaturase (delta-9 desaturase)
MGILLLLVIHWYASLFFQSFFHHRYSAHRLFTMSRGWEKFFYICCFITQGSSYISAGAYGMMHRLHHAHTDLENDPHSPSNKPNPFALLVETRNNYFSIYCGKTVVEEKYKKDLPEWAAFDKIAHNWITRLLWAALYVCLYVWLATAWWQYLFLPITLAMGSVQGMAVNWWAHRFGYENYKMANTSKNILPIDFLFWGEAYHNNHHKHPGRANNAMKWFEIDSTFIVMKMMDKLKIIRLKKVPALCRQQFYEKLF